jgi:hypothetical protein
VKNRSSYMSKEIHRFKKAIRHRFIHVTNT